MSVLLVIGGFATVGVAKQLAASEGIVLTDEASEDGSGYVYTYDYSQDSIGRITVNVKEADINIIGGAEKPYIELVNFSEGMYEFSSTNRILTVNNNTDLSSPANIASLAMSFKGLRGFVNYYNLGGLPKIVNIYLCDANPVKIVDCTAETGNVIIEDCDTATDYNVTIGTGDFAAENVSTTSALNLVITDGDAKLDDCDITKLAAELKNGSLDATAQFGKVDASLTAGDFNYNCYGILGLTNLSLFSNVGKITVDGVDHGGYLENNDVPTENIIDVDIAAGDINIISMVPRG
ncbi:MAG: DUF4097 family beta strand repeat protein [Clostridia bacterium]|nr:DUF4097 family beta strand repeat protein [Clostridia bacterium]